MISFPNAKINLGLRITEKRKDGYHNLESVFYPVPLCDALEVLVTEENNSIEFSCTGITLPDGENLCVKAARLMMNTFPDKLGGKGIRIHLHKVIPIGAGLGGGSSDAAQVILSMNKLCQLNLSDVELAALAGQIGSDCSFFIQNKPVTARGRGDLFSETKLKLNGLYIVLVKPDVHISTPWAYSQVVPAKPKAAIEKIIALQPEEWTNTLFNDFELPVLQKYPGLNIIKDNLYAAGAVFASMSGSGSAFFGLFRQEPDPANITGQSWMFRL